MAQLVSLFQVTTSPACNFGVIGSQTKILIVTTKKRKKKKKIQSQTFFQLLLQQWNQSHGKHDTSESCEIFDKCFTVRYPSFSFGPYSCKKDSLETSKNLQTYNPNHMLGKIILDLEKSHFIHGNETSYKYIWVSENKILKSYLIAYRAHRRKQISVIVLLWCIKMLWPCLIHVADRT